MLDDEETLPWLDIDDDDQEPVIDLHHDPKAEEQHVEAVDNSKEMWKGLEYYHNMGLSMMWGRAQDEVVKGRLKKAKSPLITTWSSEVEARLSLEALSQMMIKANPNIGIAPIIICGKGSGNLIAIDIDCKHWQGIDTRFFKAIQDTFPHIWKQLRIHRTPSGGFHILYRTEVFIDFGNQKLAYKEGEKEAGIETRGHGGYILSPPGMGYSVYVDNPIPVLSVDDHERLIDLAKLFNEKVVIKSAPKQKSYESIYDENPFEHFNNSPAAERVLLDNGWNFDYENASFAHYTRPGKDGGVSASWHKEKRFYHFFTSSTEFDLAHFNGNYAPAKALNIVAHGGDWKKTYIDLKDRGFGRHKPEYEEKVIRKLKETGKDLPANFSQEAREKLKVAIAEKNEKYPHGIFWEFNPNTESYIIQRELLAQFMKNLGLRLYKGQPVIIEGQFIRKLKEDKKLNGAYDVYSLLKSWIREEEEDIFKRISHEFSKFWQASGDFMVSKLEILDESILLKSNQHVCYKVFLNGVLEITKTGKRFPVNSGIDGLLVFEDSIIQHEFNYVGFEEQQKSMFVDYTNKAFRGEYRYKQLCIGYLGHDNKKGEQYLVCLLEPMATEDGGGTGKNVFCYMLSPWTSVLTTDAQALKRDVDQLIQNWNGERLVHLSDFPKWTDLGRLKNIITDDSQRKLLYKDISNVSRDDMPKFVLSGQHGLDTESDGGVKRRVRIISFTGYFNRRHGLRDEYGGEWPDVWKKEDWDGYFSYMADATVEYLKEGKVPVVEDLDIWLKGFDLRYSGGDNYFRVAIEEKIDYWAGLGTVSSNEVLTWYDDLYGKRSSRGKMSSKMLHKAMREYGLVMKRYDYDYGDHIRREVIDGVQRYVVKIKMFGEVVKEKDPWD